MISVNSPIARGLIGKEVDDVAPLDQDASWGCRIRNPGRSISLTIDPESKKGGLGPLLKQAVVLIYVAD